MKLSQRQNILVERLLESWVQKGMLSEDKADELKADVEIKTLNWKRIARNMLGLSVLFMVIAFLHLVVDKWVLELVESFIAMSNLFFMGLLTALTVIFTLLAKPIASRKPSSVISIESLLLLSILSFSGAVYYAVQVFALEGFGKVASVLLVSMFTLGLSRLFRSHLTWIIGLSGVFLWITLETARLAGWDSAFIGMNLPLRWLIVSSFFLLLTKGLSKFTIDKPFYRVTVQFWLVVFWFSLWLCALFGNYSSFDAWDKASAVDLLPWGILMTAIALAALVYGKWRSSKEWVWMGSMTLMVNLYTQYFLFLWQPLPPALFFFILALSFFMIGRKAELIWGRK